MKDQADDIACQLLKQVLSSLHSVETIPSSLLSADVVETIERWAPTAICVVGVAPQAISHIRVRCQQLRARFPDAKIVACVLSTECELANVRGRVPMSDADHVVCSLQQAQEYLNSLSSISVVPHSGDRLYLQPLSASSSVAVPLDESSDAVFAQVTMTLAKPSRLR